METIYRTSDPVILNTDLWYICECARITKMKFMYLDAKNNKLYGIGDEAFGIHEMNLPFLSNIHLTMYMPAIDKNIVKKYDQFFVDHHFPWAIIPIYYLDMFKAGDIIVDFDMNIPRAILLDKTTKLPIECIYIRNLNQDIQFDMFNRTLDAFLTRRYRWYNPIYIKDIHKDPNIINGFFNQKSTFGGFIVNIYRKDLNKQIPLTFFKGMIPLNKSDTMDAELYLDRYNKTNYMLVLYPKKKKDPIVGNKYGIPFSDTAYYCYRDIT